MVFRFLQALVLLIPLYSMAQFTYTIDQSIPVEENGRLLKMPWAGGVNSAQLNTMDLNDDGKDDLVVMDKSANKILTYLNEDSQYQYHPEFENLFPSEVTQWLLLRDFNCDGRKDIFTSDPFGIAVFVNTTAPGANLTWRRFNGTLPLLTEGFSSNINLKVNDTDIPAIDDIDGDGDLDIINTEFAGFNSSIEWHQNMSMERTGTCDSLQLKRVTQTWGEFEECGCGDFAFGQTCVEKEGGRTKHSGGKALMTIDLDNDGDKDLLFSEEACPTLFLLRNNGTAQDALMNSASTFPAANPINFLIYPATFHEDVDFDGVADIIASPNVNARTNLNNSFQQSVWFYKNIGSTQNPSFVLQQNNFLQDEMIEVGDYAYPAFVDYDGDGDSDMFIGNYGNNQFIGVISQYENIGTPGNPSFRLVTSDFANYSQFLQFNVKPQFIDINSDGNMDLTIVSTDPSSFATNLLYVPGKSSSILDLSNQPLLSTQFALGIRENVLAVDVDLDGKVDLLKGTASGALEYYKNVGAPGTFNYILEDDSFMGLGPSVSRVNLSASVFDMDADGRQDLIIGDQLGRLSIYGDFRGTQSAPAPVTSIIYDSFRQTYTGKNMGGRIKPTAVNLFNSDKPAIVVGTVMGGLYVLKNDGGQQLLEEPTITLYPNPLPSGEALFIQSDMNILMQIFTVMGQKMGESVFVTANQAFPFPISGLASGIYIARFTFAGKSYGRRFVIY
ncbi:MAG: T9SS type A sorting domain-containing protein [Cyclobacteriaceae bacterium]